MNLAWNEQGSPIGVSIDQLLYRIRSDDGREGLIFDSVTLNDILSEDGVEQFVFDAMVTPFSRLRRKMEQMLKVMNRAVEGLDVTAMQVSNPFRRNGVAQVAAVFELSDGQTVTVYFHNPDSTPNKLTPTDEMVSWKWMLNKKDITIVVAPEKGKDLAVREVSRRIMRLAERNSQAFARQNAQRAERLERIQGLKYEIGELEQALEQKQRDLDLARVEAESRALTQKELTAEEGMTALNGIKRFLSRAQYRTIAAAMKGEEKQFFIDKARLLADIINGMAETYEQDGKGMDATAYLHYFKAGADWYITEKDSQGGTQQAFGWANLGHGGELGYISIDELTQNNAELNLHFDPQPLSGVTNGSGEQVSGEDNSAAGLALVSTAVVEFEGELSDWEPVANQWQYADLRVGETTLRMGVSSGGVVSVNGKPHDPEGRIIDSEDSLRAAIVAALPKGAEQQDDGGINMPAAEPVADEQQQVVELTGTELGEFPDTPEGKKALRAAAIKFYEDNLMGSGGVLNLALDKLVEFDGRGRGKIRSFSADPRKLHVVAKLESIVRNGKPTPISPMQPHADAARSGVKRVHVLKAQVLLGGNTIRVRFLVHEMTDGHFFYDHSIDREEVKGALGGSAEALDSAGAADLNLPALLPDEPSPEQRSLDSVASSGSVFNLFIEGEPLEALVEDDEADEVDPEQALQQAREQTDTDPTDEQKENGDYQKGELSAFGLDLVIENPKGHVRSGKSANGDEWSVSMAHDYGYIKGTKGLDGDEVDLFIGPNLESEKAFVIEQIDPSGKLDEHKVMLGFDDEESAKQGYLSSYKAGWDGLGSIREMSLEELKAWLPNAANTPEAAEQGEVEAAPEEADPAPQSQDGEAEQQDGVEPGQDGGQPLAKQVSHDGVSVVVPQIDQALVDEYNRAVHMGEGRDLNGELEQEAYDLLEELTEHPHTLATAEQQACAGDLVASYLAQLADFHRWNARQAANNPSWLVTGRSGRDMAKAAAANERHMDSYRLKVDQLEQQRRAIADTLYAMRPDEVKADQRLAGDLFDAGRVIADIAGMMREGKRVLEKETRGWASPKAHRLITRAAEQGREQVIAALGKWDSELEDVGGIVKVLGPRSKAGQLVAELLKEPALDSAAPAEPEDNGEQQAEPEAQGKPEPAGQEQEGEGAGEGEQPGDDPQAGDGEPEEKAEAEEAGQEDEPAALDSAAEPEAEPEWLQAVIDGTAEDMLTTELGDRLAGLLERFAGNEAVMARLEQAVAAYQKAMEQSLAQLQEAVDADL